MLGTFVNTEDQQHRTNNFNFAHIPLHREFIFIWQSSCYTFEFLLVESNSTVGFWLYLWATAAQQIVPKFSGIRHRCLLSQNFKGQRSRNDWAGWVWLTTAHEVAVAPWAGATDIWWLAWGWSVLAHSCGCWQWPYFFPGCSQRPHPGLLCRKGHYVAADFL